MDHRTTDALIGGTTNSVQPHLTCSTNYIVHRHTLIYDIVQGRAYVCEIRLNESYCTTGTQLAGIGQVLVNLPPWRLLFYMQGGRLIRIGLGTVKNVNVFV